MTPIDLSLVEHRTNKHAWNRRALSIGAMGSVGVVGLLIALPELLRMAPPPPLIARLPVGAQAAIMLANPLLYVWIAAGVGASFAWRVGLRSHIADGAATGFRDAIAEARQRVRLDARIAALTGLALGLMVAGADRLVFSRLLSPAWQALIAEDGGGSTVRSVLSGMLYGGIAEEVMLRWGVLSIVAALLASLSRRLGGSPTVGESTPGVMWAAIVIAAAVFGLGHLPAAAAAAPLDAISVTRILIMNAIAALAYGALYYRRGLEAAMLAHMASHPALALWGLILR